MTQVTEKQVERHTSKRFVLRNDTRKKAACYTLVDPTGIVLANIYSDELAPLLAAAPDLLAACKFFIGSLDDGDLVRDISKDHKPEWTLKMLKFMSELAEAQAAIAAAEGRAQ